MIDLGSIGGLHARQHEVHAYCPRCDRWAVLPLAQMVTNSQGERRLPIRGRCRWCLAVGLVAGATADANHGTSGGWIHAESALVGGPRKRQTQPEILAAQQPIAVCDQGRAIRAC